MDVGHLKILGGAQADIFGGFKTGLILFAADALRIEK